MDDIFYPQLTEMDTLLKPDMNSVLYGAAMGYVGMNLFQWYKGGNASLIGPSTLMSLAKTEPIQFLLPILAGYVGYKMGGDGTMGYVYGAVAGALAQMMGPSLSAKTA